MDTTGHRNPDPDERALSFGRGDRQGDRPLSEDSAAAAFGAWIADLPEAQHERAPDVAPCPALTGFLTALGYYTHKTYPAPPAISRWQTLDILESLSYAVAWCLSRREPDETANYVEWRRGMDRNRSHTDTAEWVFEHWREADTIAGYLDAGEEMKGFEHHADTAGRMAAIVIAYCTYPDVRERMVAEFLEWAAADQS